MRTLAYRGVGTVEFLYEGGEFYFIEMNTRLQVEHTITEMITGLDLVIEQIRIAAGAPLTLRQEDIRFNGHAIECRINAENPHTFRPSPGTITHFHPPGGLGVRVDSGAYAGYTIPPYYDSLIGKLIVHARTRNECLMRLKRALGEFVVDGIETTIPLFTSLISEPDIVDGNYDIHWLENHLAKANTPRVIAMTSIDDVMIEITPQVLLKAYACGIFPMAESAEDNALYWIEPERRGILPLDRVHVPRRLARTIRNGGFEVKVDRNFEAVIEGCAAPRSGRRSTWINGRIRSLYRELFALGHCHTIEVWQEGELVGGLYGVHLGRAFFGESMFSRARDASKIALVYLIARLKYGGFTLLDTQFVTGHLARFGAIEVSREEFQRLLEAALGGGLAQGNGSSGGAAASSGGAGGGGGAGAAAGAGAGAPAAGGAFALLPEGVTPPGVLQLVSQTSNTGCSTA